MILGIGIDFVKVSRMRKLYLKHPARAFNKILSTQEQSKISGIKLKSKQIQYLAKRFVAKEALVKAMGTGLNAETFLKDISVLNTELGQPYYLLNAKIQKQLEHIFKIKKYSLHLSLSDDKENALAVAIIESHDTV